MEQDFAVADAIATAIIAGFSIFGLIRGISGFIGSVIWLTLVLLTGYFSYSPIKAMLGPDAFGGGNAVIIAAVSFTIIFALVVATIGRFIIKKFVSVLVPQPFNAIIGALVGGLQGLLIVSLLISFGVFSLFSNGGKALWGGESVMQSTFLRSVGDIGKLYLKSAAGIDGHEDAKKETSEQSKLTEKQDKKQDVDKDEK